MFYKYIKSKRITKERIEPIIIIGSPSESRKTFSTPKVNSLMAEQSDTRATEPVTGGTDIRRGKGSVRLVCRTLLPLPALGLFTFFALRREELNALPDALSPPQAAFGQGLPGVSGDVTLYQGGFEGVLITFPLSSFGSFITKELHIKHLLRESHIWHANYVACPATLIECGQCFNTGDISLVEDTDVGAPVLPGDLQDLAETSLMIYLQRLEVPSIHHPCLGSIQEGKLQRPVLSIHPMVVTVGNSTELRCEISGEIPPLTFIFYKYSGRYLRLADTKDTNKSFATHTLKVAENTVKDYCCKVHGNSKDSISNYSEIVKLSVQALEVSKPILQSDSNTNTLKKGQALTLKCTVSKGSFPITYMFFHGSLNHSTTSSYNEEKYLIRSVNNHHSGRYYCTASNAATSEAKQSNHIVMEVFGCSQAAVPVAWILVTTLLLSISIICSN
uniref:platelet endothelial cell adhesion molecule-like isoform X1 n=1 Tax=Pristiophorus japonicus TaxID=55135 RepID=UPI00398F8735